MVSVRTWLAVAICAFVLACQRSAPAEQKVHGTWEYSGMDDLVAWMDERPRLPERKPHVTGRIIFRRDHTLADLLKDNVMTGGRWMTIGSGTWALEGDTIVIDQQPLQGHLSPGEKPFSRRVVRVHISEFHSDRLERSDGGGTFKRVKPWWRFW
jgi:hypothetical protein